MATAAIMQPHYLPWPGYFDMMSRADVFVLLDTVSIDRQSWQTRNRIRARDGSTVWLSIPVHARMGQPLKDVWIDNTKPWYVKHWRTIEQAYSRTPGWMSLERTLLPHYTDWSTLLLDMTSATIDSIAALLGISTPIVRASSLGSTRAGRIERLIDLCRLVEADTLLASPGSADYLNETMLDGIHLEWHDYQPQPYDQHGMEWQSHLSILDLIAHCGNDSTTVISGIYTPQGAGSAQTTRRPCSS